MLETSVKSKTREYSNLDWLNKILNFMYFVPYIKH